MTSLVARNVDVRSPSGELYCLVWRCLQHTGAVATSALRWYSARLLALHWAA